MIFKYYVTDIHGGTKGKQSIDCQIAVMCLESFTALVKVMCTSYKKKLLEFMIILGECCVVYLITNCLR